MSDGSIPMKPCPFCGCHLVEIASCDGMPRHPRNDCFLSGLQFVGPKRTPEAWNTRPSDDVERVARLEEALRPFAQLADRFADKPGGVAYIEVFVNDLRAAYAAIAALTTTGGGRD